MTLDDCEEVFEKALASSSELEFCRIIEPLFSEYEILSLELGRGSILWRARIIKNEPFQNLSELDYPPAECVKLGRLNNPGEPCFYVSTCQETALAEVEAKEGQRVQIAGFRVLNESPIQLAVIGEYANVHKNGYMHFAGCDPDMTIAKSLNAMQQQEALKRIYIDKFFAYVLSDPNAAYNGYRLSRALAQSIYSRNCAGGIVFPSVKDRGGFNVGVRADVSDSSFHNVCCLVAEVGKARHFGFIDFAVIKSAESLNDDNNFVWRRQEVHGIVGIYGMSKEEFEVASRDPSDRNGILNMLHGSRQ